MVYSKASMLSDAFESGFKCDAFDRLASTVPERLRSRRIGIVRKLLCEEGRRFLTEGDVESGVGLGLDVASREGALFELLLEEEGLAKLDETYETYYAAAAATDANLLVGTPTRRASAARLAALGYAPEDVARVTRLGAEYARGFRTRHPMPEGRIAIVAGDVGPKGDGPGELLEGLDAYAAYHQPAVDALAEGGADVVRALTMTTVAEAAGVAVAAGRASLPCVCCFAITDDGVVPDGRGRGLPLGSAILETDAAVAALGEPAPLFFGVDVGGAPASASRALDGAPPEALDRLGHLRVTAEEAEPPEALGARCEALAAVLPKLKVVGGGPSGGRDDGVARSIGEALSRGCWTSFGPKRPKSPPRPSFPKDFSAPSTPLPPAPPPETTRAAKDDVNRGDLDDRIRAVVADLCADEALNAEWARYHVPRRRASEAPAATSSATSNAGSAAAAAPGGGPRPGDAPDGASRM